MISGVANNEFVQQKFFTVPEEKYLHTEHGLDVSFTKF